MNISLITEGQTEAAKNVVLQGFKERFGVIIDGLNPDLDDITGYYKEDKFFYVGHYKGELAATGAFILETPEEARVVRMSVVSSYRGLGLGRKMLQFLEQEAQRRGAIHTVLETNKEWSDAISFYRNNGYQPYKREAERIHFRKKIST
ncbi:GNAT family N-acetyltransferase [Rossellomorea vietnamensis]|uniref:GNAT family N-acetyltransferase n=1 Tax=Rossellomorea vietnamensis TaxID=218284 RepID=A0A5D4NM06_9BACI|nr:GNAT family N-acetyltransferase [Rossellomorea vietnamensis]TYS14940.1 GNAT family N-acetyltransferase [Rossellomorea vietnamensis]